MKIKVKRLQARIVRLLSLVVCAGILWAVYETRFPVESPSDGLINALMAFFYCLPIMLINSWFCNKLEKEYPEEF